MTWEQKEQVLRELFGRMNSKAQRNQQTQLMENANNMQILSKEQTHDEDDLDYADRNALRSNKDNNTYVFEINK